MYINEYLRTNIYHLGTVEIGKRFLNQYNNIPYWIKILFKKTPISGEFQSISRKKINWNLNFKQENPFFTRYVKCFTRKDPYFWK